MRYNEHYDRLIERAQSRTSNGYVERHHIVPKCIGGTDSDDNLVDLTAEEHFVAHQLLVKMYPENKKLLNALSKMCSSSSKNPRTNKWYGWIRKRYSQSVSGQDNPSAKFTNQQVLEIYHSEEGLEELAKRYNVSRYNIVTIKRKIYYRSVTKDIDVLPGQSNKDLRKMIPIDLIEKIFYDTGDYEYFWNKYRATYGTVRSIKGKKSWKKITSKLGTPGQVKRYSLTNDDVSEIYMSRKSLKELSEQYGVHLETVRNIKKGLTRYEIWDDF